MPRPWAALAACAAALIVLPPGRAVADPAPEDPAPADAAADPAPGAGAVPFLLAAGQEVRQNPMQAIADYLTQSPQQTTAANPAVAGAADPLAAVGLLMPQTFGMPAGDQPSPYTLSPNVPSGFARVDAYQGVHALLHSGLGRMPGSQLGEPLPGTAPPPNAALPPGLAQFYPDPAAADPAAVPPGAQPPADPLPLVAVPPAG